MLFFKKLIIWIRGTFHLRIWGRCVLIFSISFFQIIQLPKTNEKKKKNYQIFGSAPVRMRENIFCNRMCEDWREIFYVLIETIKLWTKVEPVQELIINSFGSATLFLGCTAFSIVNFVEKLVSFTKFLNLQELRKDFQFFESTYNERDTFKRFWKTKKRTRCVNDFYSIYDIAGTDL